MKHFRLIVLRTSAVALVLASTAVFLGSTAAGASSARKGKTVAVNLRVEGMQTTLLNATVRGHATSIDPDGKPADTCEGLTAAAALQQGTQGKWSAGEYFSGLGYSVVGILGESYPFTSPYYWSFWVDGKVASAGICTVALHPREKLLFFPQCSKQSASECPQGLFNPAVLELKGRTHAQVGKTVTFKVLSRENLTGKPTPGKGVSIAAGGHTVRADASGTAKLRFAKAGRYRVVASGQDTIRDELTVTVRR